jgi:sterol desaturase/sphingolipid hydroxylase (fatty acid hydroxylase superfamily)
MPFEEQTKVTASTGPRFSLETTEPTAFGRGWISGFLSALFGLLGLGAVLCFHFPDWLTLPQLRPYYAVPYVRAAIYLLLVTSFLLGIVSFCLRRNKAFAVVGMTLTLVAVLLGGSRVPLPEELTNGPFLGLDWFLLNLIVYSALYIPLERSFAKHPEQPTFRSQWRVDLTYFFLNTLLIQFTTLLTLMPAMVFFNWARIPAITRLVAQLPLLVQIPAVLVVADFTQYWIHRAFHVVPLLWRFHSIHHSAEAMDWLAGSRLHIVDAVATRGLTYIPIYVLGFSDTAMYAYVLIVVVQATFIHANVGWEFPGIRRLVATPCFHHWHHAAEPEAVDKNFSVHSPLWDWLFGTLYMPGRWPSKYGLCGKSDVPASWVGQFVYPIWRKT